MLAPGAHTGQSALSGGSHRECPRSSVRWHVVGRPLTPSRVEVGALRIVRRGVRRVRCGGPARTGRDSRTTGIGLRSPPRVVPRDVQQRVFRSAISQQVCCPGRPNAARCLKIKLGFSNDTGCRDPMVHRDFNMTSRRSTAGRPSSTTVHLNGSNHADEASARPNWSSGWIDQAVGSVRGPQPRPDTGPIRRPMIAMNRGNT